ncbi:hypothetical protein GQ44DRAFT_236804 [Phaeosphaeriaceae sp. PMI808]|nr:hypothetical protein GQ44DRAFT_236804 [Phaeosphaeriaceae sp. PMI808]
MPKIVRLTLFKIQNAEAIQEMVKKYSMLTQDAKKDGKPYIEMAAANPTYEDPRNQGYTMVARTVFESKEAMAYYDTECEAHSAIKALLKPKLSGPPLVLYMDA